MNFGSSLHHVAFKDANFKLLLLYDGNLAIAMFARLSLVGHQVSVQLAAVRAYAALGSNPKFLMTSSSSTVREILTSSPLS
jgi:hypothetical protein